MSKNFAHFIELLLKPRLGNQRGVVVVLINRDDIAERFSQFRRAPRAPGQPLDPIAHHRQCVIDIE